MRRAKYSIQAGLCVVAVVALVLLAVVQGASRQSNQSGVLAKTTFPNSGNAAVECVCILATSGCTLAVFDKAAGSQRVDWRQTISVLAGREVDLASACYRKRDTDTGGKGLCCLPGNRTDGTPDPKDIDRFYGAKVIAAP